MALNIYECPYNDCKMKYMIEQKENNIYKLIECGYI